MYDTKVCTKCLTEKAATEFDISPKGRIYPRCKPCREAAMAERQKPTAKGNVHWASISLSRQEMAAFRTSAYRKQFPTDSAALRAALNVAMAGENKQ